MDFFTGPQIKGLLLSSGGGDRLLIKFSHIAGDTGALKEVAADIAGIYRRLGREPSWRPEPNIAGRRDWGQALRQVPWWAYPRVFRNFLRARRANERPRPSLWLPLPTGPNQPAVYCLREIPPGRVAALKQYGYERDATLNDLVVAAVHRAIASVGRWDGRSYLRLTTTLDCRKWYLRGGRAAAICNLSTFEYVHLGYDLGATYEDTLARVVQITYGRKADWPGLTDICLGLICGRQTYPRLSEFFGGMIEGYIRRRTMAHALTNLGPIEPASLVFDESPRYVRALPPFLYPPVFGCGLSGYAGGLTLSAGVPLVCKAVVEDFLDRVLAELPGY
jgi:NRPS condensation-like uncharacterized protein